MISKKVVTQRPFKKEVIGNLIKGLEFILI